jgi:NAD(P)-dependent dehydrogenase (short-subunit alcohol dehydrogenase family)
MNNYSFSSNDLILVTGASSGIGKATVLLLNEMGARVLGVARRQENLIQVQKECKNPQNFFFEVKDLSLDIANIPNFINELSKKYGKFSGYVHAAGVLNPQPLKMFEYEDCLKDFNTNLFSSVMITKAVCAKKNRQEKLNIVYVSSITASIGNPGSLTYSMTKSAINSMVTTLAQEVGSQKININSVMPGGTNTDMALGYNDMVHYNYLEKVKEKTIFKELGNPKYIADVILFLLSPRSYWIQGQNIVVDGGETLS